MIVIRFQRDKQKYIAFINAQTKKEAKQKLLNYAGNIVKIKSIKNKYAIENKIMIN